MTSEILIEDPFSQPSHFVVQYFSMHQLCQLPLSFEPFSVQELTP